MGKKNIKGPAPDNTKRFHRSLRRLLEKYEFHPEGTEISLATSNFNFHSEDLRNCPKRCIRTAEVCDENGQNCHIRVWCECDDHA